MNFYWTREVDLIDQERDRALAMMHEMSGEENELSTCLFGYVGPIGLYCYDCKTPLFAKSDVCPSCGAIAARQPVLAWGDQLVRANGISPAFLFTWHVDRIAAMEFVKRHWDEALVLYTSRTHLDEAVTCGEFYRALIRTCIEQRQGEPAAQVLGIET